MADEKAIETIVPPIAEEKVEKKEEEVIDEDLEAKVQSLEAEKSRLIEEGANYKIAYLKEKHKKEDYVEDESDDDRMRRIASETVADSRLAEITREQNIIIKKALKENKELKLAISNKTNVASSQGKGSEGMPVMGTSITSDQLAAFKARNWSDKDIERYKRNLKRYATN